MKRLNLGKFIGLPKVLNNKMLNITINNRLLFVGFSLFSLFSVNANAAESASTYFSSASFLEVDWDKQDQQDNYTFDGQWLYGSDYDKLAVLTQGDLIGNDLENSEIQFLYSKYIATFWDARFGIRQEIKPESETSLVIGIEGLAPYWFDVGSSLYVSENGDVSVEIELAYEVQLTQQMVIQFYTNADFNAYSDQTNNVGSGLAEADYGAQLRYEFNRHIAVYLDLNKTNAFGDSKSYLELAGEDYSETALRLGAKVFNF
jgi:copper resistance protein B